MSRSTGSLQKELSEIVAPYPHVDAVLSKMNGNLDDSFYDGDPSEVALRVEEMMEEEEVLRMIEYHGSSEIFINAEDLNEVNVGSFTASMLISIMNADIEALKAVEPNLSRIFKECEAILSKSDLGLEIVTGEPKKPKLVRRKLESTRKRADHQPKRLGPHGTWVNDPVEEEGGQTLTTIVGEKTVASLRRQETLTTTSPRRQDTLTD